MNMTTYDDKHQNRKKSRRNKTRILIMVIPGWCNYK